MAIMAGKDETMAGMTEEELFDVDDGMTLDVLLSNQELCSRLVDMVEEVKEILQ